LKEIEPAGSTHEARSAGLVQKDRGIYDPSSIVKTKSSIQNVLATPITGSSPSSSQEGSLRNAQSFNARSTQTNVAINIQEPPTPSPGFKSGTGSDFPAPLKDIHEYFISAVLGSFVYFLCHNQNFIPLNSRTLILAAPHLADLKENTAISLQAGSPVELATLDISLTSLGALVVKAHCALASGLQSLECLSRWSDSDKLAVGSSLWLAPGGNPAKFYGTLDDFKVGETLPIAQFQHDNRVNNFTASTLKAWQTKCLEWLSSRGLNEAALESGGWLFVQILGRHLPYPNNDIQGSPGLEELAVVPWPAILCFQTSSTGTRALKYFAGNGTNARDPLAFAEDWFAGKDERANAILKRQLERQTAEALSKEQADIEARALQSNIYSPAALRRGSNAGAMYPTPPDAPHHPIGATPSFDGNVSTPGNPNSFPAHDPAAAPAINNGLMDIDVDMWTSSEKKERIGSGINFNENSTETDNLYGDLSGDIFGTDITDADFSFFDEPDSVQLDHRPSSPDISPMPPNQSASNMHESPVFTAGGDPQIDTEMVDIGEGISNEGFRAEVNISIKDDSDTPLPTSDQVVEDHGPHAVSDQSLILPVRMPFNKQTVFDLLLRNSTETSFNPQTRRASLFNGIKFEDSLMSVNAKYGVHGQFNFRVQKKRPSGDLITELPQTGYLSSKRRARDNKQELGYIPRLLIEKEPTEPSNEPMDYLIDSDGASQVSEQDDTSHSTDDPSSDAKIRTKQKWEADEAEQIKSSLDALAMDLENSVGTPQSINGSQIPLLDTDPADWSLTTYFTSPEPDVQSNVLSDVERIATAQILTEQAVSGTLRVPGASNFEVAGKQSRIPTTRELMQNLARAAKLFLKDLNACNLRSFLEIQGIPVSNQGLRLPPRPMASRSLNGSDATKPNNPFQLPPPQLELRRSDVKLSILPSAVTFWENLGLGPSNGVKDINAVCVYPNMEGVARNASVFLDQMRSMYETSRFGVHNRLTSKDIVNGLVPFPIDSLPHNLPQYTAILKETTAHLCRALSSLTVEESNFVVYFVYPEDDASLLVQICSAFRHLFNLYKKALSEKRMSISNELVLQLIPLSFVASPTSLAVPLPIDYFHLAMEVYDRCVDFASSSSAPAIMLEQPLPKMIDFKLNANPSASVLQENTCLHVAYAQSIDDRWVTAAWTDNRGTQQMTASYCLGRKNEPMSIPFSQIASEIWETTLDYISSKKIHWRVMIARVGVMEPSEIEFWTSLASAETGVQLSLSLITVHTDPSIRLLPSPTVLTQNGSASSSVITPVSTPQALQSSIVSPETANTPARENTNATPIDASIEPDSDARLIDSTDQSWGAVLGHRLNNSNSLLELNLALISGYLIKRGGTNNEDPPIVMEVNIVYSEVVGNPRTFHESLLREILGYYRGLGSLARVRGIVDAVKDVRPWHIAAAEKAVKALYMLM
jgi:mediator of RNA polymerase II transcription subunit 13